MPTYIPRALGAPVLINDSNGYMVLIGGQPVFVIGGSLSFERSVGRNSQASFTVRSSDTDTHYKQYQQVLIYDASTTLVFSGYINAPKERMPASQRSLLHTISCIDQHWLAVKRRVSASFVNKTCGYIVQWLLDNILSQEGVELGMIYDGVTPSDTLYPANDLYPGGNIGLIGSVTFSYCKVSEALDKLVEAASSSGVPYFWSIDQNKRLYFVPYSAIENDVVVDGNQIDLVNNPPNVTHANPSYLNTEYVAGGTAETLTQTEIRKGDGNTQAWTMSYAFSRVPTVTVNGVSKTVGIKGVESGRDFYWNKGDPTLSQDSGATKLTSSDTLQVVYIGQYPNVVIASNSAQIQYQASIDGTSGIVEDVVTDSTISTVSDGLELASQRITRYATQGASIQFNTRRTDFNEGQLINVDLPQYDLGDTQMLVESVVGGDQVDGLNLWFTVTAVAGPYDNNWQSFFSKLLATPQIIDSINVGESQSITILQPLTLNMAPTMTLTANVYACPVVNTTLYPNVNLYPC